MHHYRLIEDSDLPTTDVLDAEGEPTGETRTMDHGELQQVNLFHVCDLPASETIRLEDGADYTLAEDGALYLAAASTRAAWEDFPGRVVTSGFLNDRNQRLPANVRERAWQAAVYRATDGSDLRGGIKNDLGLDTGVGPKVPADGSHSATPEKPEQAEQVLEEARNRAADPDAPVERRRVAMRDVQDTDVVETDEIYPLRIAGERGDR